MPNGILGQQWGGREELVVAEAMHNTLNVFALCLVRVYIFSFLEMNDLELAFLETYPSFPSHNAKKYPKSDNRRRRKHTRHSTKSRE